MRASESFTLVLEPPASAEALAQLEVLGEEPAAHDQARKREATASARRMAKRAAYMDVVGQRNDSSFFAGVFALVLAAPVGILVYAWQHNWLLRF